LRKFLKKNLVEHESLAVAEPKLGNLIKVGHCVTAALSLCESSQPMMTINKSTDQPKTLVGLIVAFSSLPLRQALTLFGLDKVIFVCLLVLFYFF